VSPRDAGRGGRPPGGPPPFTPDNSIVENVPGVSGGFPAGSIRAKTAEALAFPADIPIPAGSEAIHINWPTPQARLRWWLN
jgi:hypothetical protein